MSISRGLCLLRQAKNLSKPFGAQFQQIREGHGLYSYRCGAYPPKTFIDKHGPDMIMAVMWWWMLYHIVTEPEHITGEFPWPDAEKWTNEELGIPPDDED